MKYYLIDNDEDLRYGEGLEDAVIDYCVSTDYWEDDEDMFEEWFNENEGTVYVGSYSFEPADVLKEMDMDAYNEEFNRWINGEADNAREEAEYSFRHANIGDSFDICGYTIYVYDDGDEEDVESEDVDDAVTQVYVDKQKREEEFLHAENTRLENAFMQIFQTVQ